MSQSSSTGTIEGPRAGAGPCVGPEGRRPRIGLLGRAGEAARRLVAPMQERGWEVVLLGGAPAPAMLARLGAILLLLDADAVGSAELLGPLLEAAAGAGVGLVAIGGGTTVAERVAGLQAGLDGWIEPDSEPREAVARMAAVMRPRLERERLERAVRSHGELDVRRDLLDAVVGERHAELTTREFELLELLCACDGAVVSRERIHRALWHREPPAGDRTVDVLVSRIRRKLKSVSPDWGYLHTHPGAGYRFAAERLGAPVVTPTLAVA
jgi:DNA-binding response OmpR family regulator